MSLPIKDAKAALREDMRRRRRALFEAAPEAGPRAARIVMETGLVGPDDIAALYWPMAEEFEARPLVQALLAAGRRCVLPATPPRGEPLVFRRYGPEVALKPGRFRTLEPPPAAPALTPTVLFVPLLAFDAAGRRLGYGGGYYDRTLAGLKQAGAARAYGLGFAGQETARVPTDALDQTLDGVVTERGFRQFKSD